MMEFVQNVMGDSTCYPGVALSAVYNGTRSELRKGPHLDLHLMSMCISLTQAYI